MTTRPTPGPRRRRHCKAPKKLKRGQKKVKITCTLRLAAARRVELRRGGAVVARGNVRAGRLVTLRGRRLDAGRYTLVMDGARLTVRVR